MLSYFCPKCGGKNLYQFQKPKFCSHCGANFSITSNNIKSNQFEVSVNIDKKRNINNPTNEKQDFEEQIQDYSSMRGLDVNIEKYNNDNGIKLGELVSDEPIQSQSISSKKTIKRRGRKKISKSLPESFVSEAKMSGRNYQNYQEPNIIDNED